MSSQTIAADPTGNSDPVAAGFRKLEAKLRETQHPEEDLRLIRQAFEFAVECHRGQKRKSGEPFIVHPLAVAHILAEMRLDRTSLITGLLHDVVEDTTVHIHEIEERFGADVAECIDGVTKLSRINYSSSEAHQAENYRKMLLAMVKDIRVILVKLTDRLHNMRTLEYLSPDKQLLIARETAEIYAPIALRLGMGKVRGELADLAFRYLEPEAYEKIKSYIDSNRQAGEDFLEQMQKALARKLADAEIPVRIEGRIKRTYSVHQKLKRQRITMDQVYDLLALRVITDSVKDCYAALGMIHSQWRPVPGRIKDFIAMPRPNLYQSLHTSVISDQGQTFEVQIRTGEMHRMAEQGICAHWKYKEGRVGADVDDERMAWLRQLLEWQRDVEDPSDFLSTLKIDLYPEEVYVFTPQGKLLVLPRGATPVDFAYAIHTEVGNRCVGAKSHGRIVPLKYHLHNGDIIEILTQAGHSPSSDWLNLVKTSRARNKIKHWLNTERRKKAEEIGHKLLEKEARRLRVSLKNVAPEALAKVCRDYGYSQPGDLYAGLGYGRFSARQVLSKLAPEEDFTQTTPASADAAGAPKSRSTNRESDALIVKGIDDVLVYRARCCSPIRGEPIVGYVTRGKGVAVHSRNCPNVENLMYEAERRIEVDWATTDGLVYQARVLIYADDRPGLLSDLTNILSNDDVNILKVGSRTKESSGPAVVEMLIAVRDVSQLDKITASMRHVPSVREVTRGHRP